MVRWNPEGNMRVTASKLRENVYQILDEAIATGVPVEVIRKGKVLKIVPDKPVSKLDRVRTRKNVFVGNVEDIIGMDWSKEWTEMQ
jgi:antitoxin (DNA-binding transcriptional repressor) of toxin-antitoxin stability system